MKALIALLAAFPVLAPGQHTRHNFTFGAGAAMPKDDLEPFFRTSPVISVTYGYRFLPYLQVEGGLDTVFGAAESDRWVPGYYGPVKIQNYQFLVPFGGRAILPLWGDRLLFYGGGGGLYMNYAEFLSQPYYGYPADCYYCTGRSGWGYYALAGASVALDEGRHFRLGVTVKRFQGETEGDYYGAVPPVRTTDSWLNILGEFTFSF